MSSFFFEFVAFIGGTLFSLITAVATILIVFELRELNRQRRKQYTGEFLASFNEFSFPYNEFDEVALAMLAPQSDAVFTPETDPKQQMLVKHLNTLEMVSIQLNQGILDEDTCRDYARSMFIQAFHYFRIYILNIREATSNPRLYANFERVVRRWERLNDK
ncbi:DUF4760 domain-containing protein [uncultured Roseibium sp.]|uniref:DUF4760 domain-containing protein n=1 Tax=uncultured Roseibium sp. TaxID=1936171 RepID=UPI00263A1954|nr:DUF4760 domain-containing protein [uncultured Roseibium sp.]